MVKVQGFGVSESRLPRPRFRAQVKKVGPLHLRVLPVQAPSTRCVHPQAGPETGVGDGSRNSSVNGVLVSKGQSFSCYDNKFLFLLTFILILSDSLSTSNRLKRRTYRSLPRPLVKIMNVPFVFDGLATHGTTGRRKSGEVDPYRDGPVSRLDDLSCDRSLAPVWDGPEGSWCRLLVYGTGESGTTTDWVGVGEGLEVWETEGPTRGVGLLSEEGWSFGGRSEKGVHPLSV